jgi:nucleoid-associated protein YgaU
VKSSSVIGILIALVLVAVAAGVGWYVRHPSTPPPPPAAVEKLTPPAPKPEELPSFDVVRVENGHAVIAGHAVPGSIVTVTDGGKALGETTADAHGDWVLSLDQPLGAGNHELGITAKLPDGRTLSSERVVVVVVPEQKAQEPLAVSVPRRGPGSSKILQGAGAHKPGEFVLETVDYDDKGQIVLGGSGKKALAVHVYLDNQFLGRAPVGADGQWQLTPSSKVEPGFYAMRLDEVTEKGKVVARLIIPFSRAKPEELAPGAVVVQLGNSLWQIARHDLGVGTRYTVIYQANKGQIADPNLIYTGQVFAVPEKSGKK